MADEVKFRDQKRELLKRAIELLDASDQEVGVDIVHGTDDISLNLSFARPAMDPSVPGRQLNEKAIQAYQNLLADQHNV